MQAGCIGLIQISVEFSTEYLGSLLFQFFASLNNCLGFLLLMMNFFFTFLLKKNFHTLYSDYNISFPASRDAPHLPTYPALHSFFKHTHTQN